MGPISTERVHREINLPAPYPPIDIVAHAQPETASVIYRVIGRALAVTATVTPKTGDGTTAFPQGVTVTCTSDGHTTTIDLPDVPTRGPAPDITGEQIDATAGTSADHLAAVLSALLTDWANRDDTALLRRTAAARTA